ncbi:MAG: glycine cleavage system aminomethyltransferase GcvT [Aquiluna sp.]|nr:glycine cleavage system aminomethyltransferase GcvT [Aquiluna sp.]
MLNTQLKAEHEKLGASFTEFGGWNMPVRYGSDIDEHHSVRNGCGVFDISHMAEIRVTGQAEEFLDYALISKLSEIENGRAKYSMICAEDGGIIDDLIVYRLDDDEFMIVANAGNHHQVVEALQSRLTNFPNTTVTDESGQWSLVALQGPMTKEILGPLVDVDLTVLKYYSIAAATLGGQDVFLARTGYTGEDGFEIFISGNPGEIWQLLVSQEGVTPCGLACRDTLRLEAGMPLYGHELNRDLTPFSANLGKVIRFDKQTFVGKEALENAKHPKLKLFGLKGEGRRAARADYEVFMPGGEASIGTITSGVLSPTLQEPIALALLDSSLGLEIGGSVEADVRGTRIIYKVVELPFYKRQK